MYGRVLHMKYSAFILFLTKLYSLPKHNLNPFEPLRT